jgi:hypothetical protein
MEPLSALPVLMKVSMRSNMSVILERSSARLASVSFCLMASMSLRLAASSFGGGGGFCFFGSRCFFPIVYICIVMSCFFDAVFTRLTPEWKAKVGGRAAELPRFFADSNRETPEVLCNGVALTAKQRVENAAHVGEMRGHNVCTGYLTSFFEPYFYLCCALFDVDIRFNYCGAVASFSGAVGTGRPVWTFGANAGHIS